jgi:uncharacterized membrane protein
MKRLLNVIQTWFLTGLIVFLPFVGTIGLGVWVFNLLDGWIQPILKRFLNHEIPGVGIALLVLTTFAIGALVSNFVGKRIVVLSEAIISRIPAINIIYKFLKDFSDTFLNREKGAFKEVVAIQWPRVGFWAIGFITGDVPGALAEAAPASGGNGSGRGGERGVGGEVHDPTAPLPGSLDPGDEMVLVFLMQAFSPAAGNLVAVRKRDLVKLNMTVEEALKLILTGGIVKHPAHPPGQALTMSASGENRAVLPVGTASNG